MLALECLADAEHRVLAMVGPGNTNGTGIPGGEGYYPVYHPPGYPPTAPRTSLRTSLRTMLRACYRQYGDRAHAHMTVLGSTKEILGVEYAQVARGTATSCRTPHLTPAPPSPWAGSWGRL